MWLYGEDVSVNDMVDYNSVDDHGSQQQPLCNYQIIWHKMQAVGMVIKDVIVRSPL